MIAELAALALATGLPSTTALYRPADRSVSNWRFESLRHLDLAAAQAATIAFGGVPARLPRCVKLNNYWCIKSARWNGEIATDEEGHVAFASAGEGAAVAVALLRRYYIDFGRKSAMSIVSRWAPAQCGLVAAPRAAAGRKTAGRSSADRLTTRGMGNTLRARFLAARGGRVSTGGRRPAIRSVVPDRPMPMMRAPAIAAGSGERPVALASLAPASSGALGRITAGDRGGASIPRISCAGEAVRIRNYANAVIQGVAKDIDEDLRLFEADGAPAPNLARVMANMAAVEIGPFRPGQPLVSGVIRNALLAVEEKKRTQDIDKSPAPAN